MCTLATPTPTGDRPCNERRTTMSTFGTATDPLVIAVRSAIIDAARRPRARRQQGGLDITRFGYKHVAGDTEDLAEVAMQVLPEELTAPRPPRSAPPFARARRGVRTRVSRRLDRPYFASLDRCTD